MSQTDFSSPDRIKRTSICGYTGHKPLQQFQDQEGNPYRILNEENRKHLPGYKGYIPGVKCENVLGQGFSRVASHSIEGRIRQVPTGVSAYEDPAERFNTIQRSSFKVKDDLKPEQKDLNPFLNSNHFGRQTKMQGTQGQSTMQSQQLQGGSLRRSSLGHAGMAQMGSQSSIGSQSQLRPYHEVFGGSPAKQSIMKPHAHKNGGLSDRCFKMSQKAFKMMDKDGSGEITPSDIAGFYDVTENLDFISGSKSKTQILQGFLNSFEGTKGNHDGRVTHEEWCNYYAGIRSLLSSDDYFVRMMESTWQVPEHENTPETREVINMLMKKVKANIMSDLARQDPKLLPKVFKDLDKNSNGLLTLDELTVLIAKLKISVERRYVYPFMQLIDKDKDGGIDYSEFESYVLSK